MLDLPDTCNLIHTQDSWEEHTNITLGELAVMDGCRLWVTVFLENYKPLWILCDTATHMCARHSLVHETWGLHRNTWALNLNWLHGLKKCFLWSLSVLIIKIESHNSQCHDIRNVKSYNKRNKTYRKPQIKLFFYNVSYRRIRYVFLKKSFYGLETLLSG